MSPIAVVATLCALGGAIASVPVAGCVGESLLAGHPAGVVLIALLTASFSALVILLSLRTSVFALPGFGMLGGAAVCALSVVAVLAAQDGIFAGALVESAGSVIASALTILVIVAIYAGILGGFVGFFFSLSFLVPTAMAARQIASGRMDGDARAGVVCAAWLALVSAAALPFSPACDTWHVGTTLSVGGVALAFAVGALSIWRIVEVRRALQRPLQRSFIAVAPAH